MQVASFLGNFRYSEERESKRKRCQKEKKRNGEIRCVLCPMNWDIAYAYDASHTWLLILPLNNLNINNVRIKSLMGCTWNYV